MKSDTSASSSDCKMVHSRVVKRSVQQFRTWVSPMFKSWCGRCNFQPVWRIKSALFNYGQGINGDGMFPSGLSVYACIAQLEERREPNTRLVQYNDIKHVRMNRWLPNSEATRSKLVTCIDFWKNYPRQKLSLKFAFLVFQSTKYRVFEDVLCLLFKMLTFQHFEQLQSIFMRQKLSFFIATA